MMSCNMGPAHPNSQPFVYMSDRAVPCGSGNEALFSAIELSAERLGLAAHSAPD
jgi:hypothetical protein